MGSEWVLADVGDAGLQNCSTNTKHRRLLFSICNALNLEKEDQKGLRMLQLIQK
jgi:hypothetical protein